ncbi:MAG TPA: SRPBCC family protein [Kiloniellales bacterium]|nr:SRPBCC family protein [Kiloniellales bacterium]
MQNIRRHEESLAGRQIINVRLLDAPRPLVWQVWTDPKHITHWWGPRGFSTTTKSMDLRPGGTWLFVMHGPDGTDYGNKVTFVEVAEPERLVYRHEGTDGATKDVVFVTTVTFVEKGGQTEITLAAEFPSKAERDFVAEKYGAVEGGRQTLERLAEYLEQAARRA